MSIGEGEILTLIRFYGLSDDGGLIFANICQHICLEIENVLRRFCKKKIHSDRLAVKASL